MSQTYEIIPSPAPLPFPYGIPGRILDQVFTTFGGFDETQLACIEGVATSSTDSMDPSHHLLGMSERPELALAERVYGPNSMAAKKAKTYRAAVCAALAVLEIHGGEQRIRVHDMSVQPGQVYLQASLTASDNARTTLREQEMQDYKTYCENADDQHAVNLMLDWARRHLTFLEPEDIADGVGEYIAIALTDAFRLFDMLHSKQRWRSGQGTARALAALVSKRRPS